MDATVGTDEYEVGVGEVVEREEREATTVTAQLFGRRIAFEYSETWVAYALLALRVVMGWIFLQSGIEKVLDPEWTAAGFLQHAIPEGNPFIVMWQGFAGSPVIDGLVAWGMLLTGIGIITGTLLRWSAFWAAVMMIFFWLASLQGGLFAGLPLEHGWVVDDHIVYAFLLFGLGALGAGRVLGGDAILERTKVVRNNGWLRYILG